jgi:hypothetical protein
VQDKAHLIRPKKQWAEFNYKGTRNQIQEYLRSSAEANRSTKITKRFDIEEPQGLKEILDE